MSRATRARERWSRIIREHRASGQTVAAFCAERSIPASSFFPWRRRLAEAGEDGSAVFVEAKVGADDRQGEQGVTIVLAGGRRIMVGPGFDRRVLLEVIDALESGGREADGERA